MEFVERFYELLGAGDVDAVLDLYAPQAEIVRYDGIAGTRDDIGDYFNGFLTRHPGFSLHEIVEFRDADDVLMWDALIDTDNGVLQTVHVMIFDGDGRVRRHIPGVRGYWGL